jgi:hypothetical protein
MKQPANFLFGVSFDTAYKLDMLGLFTERVGTNKLLRQVFYSMPYNERLDPANSVLQIQRALAILQTLNRAEIESKELDHREMIKAHRELLEQVQEQIKDWVMYDELAGRGGETGLLPSGQQERSADG